MSSRLLLPFQFALLVFLHAVFALVRLVHVLSHLPQLILSLGPTSSTDSSGVSPILRDRKRWKKTPRHLAVVFVPGRPLRRWVSWWTGAPEEDDRTEVRRLGRELGQLVEWGKTLGLTSLSVYDQQGTLAPVRASALMLAC